MPKDELPDNFEDCASYSETIQRILENRIKYIAKLDYASEQIDYYLGKMHKNGFSQGITGQELSSTLIEKSRKLAQNIGEMAQFRNFNCRALLLDLFHIISENLFGQLPICANISYMLGHSKSTDKFSDRRFINNLCYRWYSICVDDSDGINIYPNIDIFYPIDAINSEGSDQMIALKVLMYLHNSNKPVTFSKLQKEMQCFGIFEVGLRNTFEYLLKSQSEIDSIGMIFSLANYHCSHDSEETGVDHDGESPKAKAYPGIYEAPFELSPKGHYFLRSLSSSCEYLFWLALTKEFTDQSWHDQIIEEKIMVRTIRRNQFSTVSLTDRLKIEVMAPEIVPSLYASCKIWDPCLESPPPSIAKGRIKPNEAGKSFRFYGQMTKHQRNDLVAHLEKNGVNGKVAHTEIRNLWLKSLDCPIVFHDHRKTLEIKKGLPISMYENFRKELIRVTRSHEDSEKIEFFMKRMKWPNEDLFDDDYKILVVLKFIESVLEPMQIREIIEIWGKPSIADNTGKNRLSDFCRIFTIRGELYVEKCMISLRAYIDKSDVRYSRIYSRRIEDGLQRVRSWRLK